MPLRRRADFLFPSPFFGKGTRRERFPSVIRSPPEFGCRHPSEGKPPSSWRGRRESEDQHSDVEAGGSFTITSEALRIPTGHVEPFQMRSFRHHERVIRIRLRTGRFRSVGRRIRTMHPVVVSVPLSPNNRFLVLFKPVRKRIELLKIHLSGAHAATTPPEPQILFSWVHELIRELPGSNRCNESPR